MRTFAALLVLSLPLWARPVPAATVPPGFTDAVFAGGFSSPVAMEFAPDGRLFVCEKGGVLRVVTAGGTLRPTPFVTLSVASGGEQGLLGIAFDPQFATNGYVYVYYSVPGAVVHNRVSRFTAAGDVAAAGSEVPILDLEDVTSMYHNGGAIHFGPDGKLYVAVGDGGPSWQSQSITSRKGKILRINPDGSIPADNPSSLSGIAGTTTGVYRSIWAAGLRNPFTFAFDPDSGRLFINDVGQATWEEVNEGFAGANYGWPTTEGDFNPATYPNFRRPLHAYGRDGAAQGTDSGECITGAAFYPAAGPFPPEFRSRFFFGDLTNQWIRALNPADNSVTLLATAVNQPVDLKVGPDGALYYLSYAGGAANLGVVGRISYAATGTAPSISAHPASQTVPSGQPATFSVSAAGSAPLGYQWQRDGADLPGANAPTCTLTAAQLSDSGAQFRCVVSNGYGTAVSNAATLTVTANQPPVPTITAPVSGAAYSAGDTIVYAGSAQDPEDGPLNGAAFTWRVDFHHATHAHPFVPDTTGSTGGSFAIPTSGESSPDVWYRIFLTVRDPAGLATTVFRDVVPNLSTFTLATVPPGLQVTLDGQPVADGTMVTGVVGLVRTLGAVSPQQTYVFSSWSDGGAADHAVATPASPQTFTATYQPVPPPPPDGGSGKKSCGATGLEVFLGLGLVALRRLYSRR